MTLAETMAMIEQDEFAAEMNLASGTTAFRRAILGHELFHSLSELAKENPSEVAERIEAISHIEVDERYENRFDTALSVYLMVLSDVAKPEVASKASQAVLRTPKIWWASGVARELLLQTVAVGAIEVGVDWRESIYVRFNEWFVSLHSSLGRDTTMRDLLKAVSTGQPTGRGRNIIEFPSQLTSAMSHYHVVPRPLLKRKKGSARLHNIAGARKRA
jgi:hypothetical protein